MTLLRRSRPSPRPDPPELAQEGPGRAATGQGGEGTDEAPISRGLSSDESRLAERAGFEPAMEFNPHTRLAGECLQPLGHLSRPRQSKPSPALR
ncbi:MAG: hypothetical protein QOH12_3915, partial [Solirubrobacteraceae bacterium]|nr:hypothetical protein [Solirubrobacteraceae bacterium]